MAPRLSLSDTPFGNASLCNGAHKQYPIPVEGAVVLRTRGTKSTSNLTRIVNSQRKHLEALHIDHHGTKLGAVVVAQNIVDAHQFNAYLGDGVRRQYPIPVDGAVV